MNAFRRDAVAKAIWIFACAALLVGLAGAALAAQPGIGDPLGLGPAKKIDDWVIGLIVVLALGLLILVGIFLAFFKIWIRALASGARVSFGTLIGMRLRKVSAGLIVDARIMAVKAGLTISTNDLETHFLAGGNVLQVIRSLIAADKANIELSFQKATAIDLAGRDVFQAVQISVKPEAVSYTHLTLPTTPYV